VDLDTSRHGAAPTLYHGQVRLPTWLLSAPKVLVSPLAAATAFAIVILQIHISNRGMKQRQFAGELDGLTFSVTFTRAQIQI
jgi:hypothetical protein